MAEKRWVAADDFVRAMGGRDHPPLVKQEPAERLPEAEVLERRRTAAARDWSKVGEEEPEPRRRRRPHFRSR